jgi:hypothetical protein
VLYSPLTSVLFYTGTVAARVANMLLPHRKTVDNGLGKVCSTVVNANRETFGWSLFDVVEAAKTENAVTKQTTHSIFDVTETVRHGLLVAAFHVEQYICQHRHEGNWWLEFKRVFASK